MGWYFFRVERGEAVRGIRDDYDMIYRCFGTLVGALAEEP